MFFFFFFTDLDSFDDVIQNHEDPVDPDQLDEPEEIDYAELLGEDYDSDT